MLLLGLALGASATERQPDPRVARALLRTGQLDALSAWVDTQRSVGNGSAFDAFRSLTPDETAALRAWVEAEPNSSIARFALAERELAIAWESGKRVRITNLGARERDVMREHLRAAVALSEAVRGQEPGWREVDRLQLVAARLLGDSELAERAWARGFAQAPADPLLWGALLDGLSSRWGGSYAQLEQAAESAQVHVATNPRLRQLLARAPADRARELREAGEFAAAIEQWDLAISFGEQTWLLRERAWTQFQAGDQVPALAGLDHVIQLAPFDADAHHRRAHVLMALERYAAAAEAAALSADLAPARDHFAWVQQSAAAKARRVAKAEALASRSQASGIVGGWWRESVFAGLLALVLIGATRRFSRRERAGWTGLRSAIAHSELRTRSDRAPSAIATLEGDE